MKTFTSADGSTRCLRCHLHPDTCTCRGDHPLRAILGKLAETLNDETWRLPQAKEV